MSPSLLSFVFCDCSLVFHLLEGIPSSFHSTFKVCGLVRVSRFRPTAFLINATRAWSKYVL
jgi:hypothetical protein